MATETSVTSFKNCACIRERESFDRWNLHDYPGHALTKIRFSYITLSGMNAKHDVQVMKLDLLRKMINPCAWHLNPSPWSW
jgi:hypothetical protein